MWMQNRINQTLNSPDALPLLERILSQAQRETRSEVGRRVCAAFDLVDGRGRLQLAGCLKALRALADAETIVLPAPRRAAPANTPVRHEGPVPAPVDVPGGVAAIGDLAVVAVESRADRKVWNTLIADEHPRGLATFAGCQRRYLVHSLHGWLGAVGFSASALRLAARERWMAWSDGQRKLFLDRVVCMSRFLIRPGVSCANLASHVLGRVLRRLPRDFDARYGYRPWLVETFVDPAHDGTCLRAANFVHVGRTAGRGRQDRDNRHAKTVKSVWMYELAPDWRRRLGVPFVDHAPSLEPGEGLDSAVWAANEFGGAPLGDKRLSARLVKSAALLSEYPGQAICGNAKTDRAAVDGYYRFIEQPDGTKVTVANILAPHRERTVRRMRSQKTVLCIQDGSDLNFARRPNCDGLGIIGRNQTASKTLGLHVHLSLAVNGEGLPLGVLRCAMDAPLPGRAGQKSRRGSQRWIDGLRDIAGAARQLTGRTRVISVMDREADFFELFDTRRRLRRVEILVRARHDRRLEEREARLFARLRRGAPQGQVEVAIERLTERRKTSGKKPRPARRKRIANCELRYRKVTLPSTLKEVEPVDLWGVHIVEIQPPEDEQAIQWFLLTSLPLDTPEAAAEIIAFYLQRWRVEDFFRVLKSGCRVEYLAFHTADRLQRAIAINSVIAWRIMLMTLLGRQVPDCDAHLMFTDHELSFLHDYAREYRQQLPDKLGPAVRLVSILGGYMNRKHDPDPGNQIMWRGYERLSAATLGHRIAEEKSSRVVLVQ